MPSAWGRSKTTQTSSYGRCVKAIAVRLRPATAPPRKLPDGGQLLSSDYRGAMEQLVFRKPLFTAMVPLVDVT